MTEGTDSSEFVYLLWQSVGSNDDRLLGVFTTEGGAITALDELADLPDDGWMRHLLSITSRELDQIDIEAVVNWPIPPKR